MIVNSRRKIIIFRNKSNLLYKVREKQEYSIPRVHRPSTHKSAILKGQW